jgi:hypothetical protein
MLLYRRSGVSTLQALYICRHDNGPYQIEVVQSASFAPPEELCDCLSVCGSGVFVSDGYSEEFQEPPCGTFAGVSDGRWQLFETGTVQVSSRWNRDEFISHLGRFRLRENRFRDDFGFLRPLRLGSALQGIVGSGSGSKVRNPSCKTVIIDNLRTFLVLFMCVYVIDNACHNVLYDTLFYR